MLIHFCIIWVCIAVCNSSSSSWVLSVWLTSTPRTACASFRSQACTPRMPTQVRFPAALLCYRFLSWRHHHFWCERHWRHCHSWCERDWCHHRTELYQTRKRCWSPQCHGLLLLHLLPSSLAHSPTLFLLAQALSVAVRSGEHFCCPLL